MAGVLNYLLPTNGIKQLYIFKNQYAADWSSYRNPNIGGKKLTIRYQKLQNV